MLRAELPGTIYRERFIAFPHVVIAALISLLLSFLAGTGQ